MGKGQLIFLSFYGDNYSRSAVLLKSDSDQFERIYFRLSHNAFAMLSQFKKILEAHRGHIAAVVVMSPSHKIVPIIRFFCRYPLILDAGWPLTDGSKSRRGPDFRWKMTTIISYSKLKLIDLFSVVLADLVLVETNEQRKRMNQKLFYGKAKLEVSLTGFNEAGQSKDSGKLVEVFSGQEIFGKSRTRILFRGKINHESGFSNIVEAFKMLGDNFEITYVVNQIPKNHTLQPNEKFITNFLDTELTSIYQQADICIGQVSSHQRLEVTIPHKAFEAAYFSKAYISAENIAIREFASEEDVLFLDKTTPEALCQAIERIAADPNLIRKLEINFKKKYNELASQKVLGAQLDEWVVTLCQPKSHKN